MKISSLIVGIIVIGLFASVFGAFFSGIATQYEADYNASGFEKNGIFDKTEAISNQTSQIRSGLETEGGDTGITDLIGGFLKKGFQVIKITFSSFDLMNEMVNEAGTQIDDRTGGSGVTNYFIPAILGIISVLFIFIIISMLVGRDI